MPSFEKVSVVIPVYNSQATIGPLTDRVLAVLEPVYPQVELVLVNDGSRDQSHARVLDSLRRHPGKIRYIRLATNFGEHSAVLCGLRHVSGDCAAIIDDDFQNPPEEIGKLLEKLNQGFDVVYSRYEHKRHHWLRNLGSAFNDRMATWLLRKPRGLYLSSFKALNAFLIRQITAYSGPFPYIDGLILRSTNAIGSEVCQHNPRAVGRSNYTLSRLIALWLNMFTGFSITPLRFVSLMGLGCSLLGFALGIFFAIVRLTGGVFLQQQIPPGWASLIVCITCLAGMQLAVLGLIGEYLGRALLTLNQTPQFIIRESIGPDHPAAEAVGYDRQGARPAG